MWRRWSSTLGRKRELEPCSWESVKHLERADTSLSDLTSDRSIYYISDLGEFLITGKWRDLNRQCGPGGSGFNFENESEGTAADIKDTVTHPRWSMKGYLG